MTPSAPAMSNFHRVFHFFIKKLRDAKSNTVQRSKYTQIIPLATRSVISPQTDDLKGLTGGLVVERKTIIIS